MLVGAWQRMGQVWAVQVAEPGWPGTRTTGRSLLPWVPAGGRLRPRRKARRAAVEVGAGERGPGGGVLETGTVVGEIAVALAGAGATRVLRLPKAVLAAVQVPAAAEAEALVAD